MKRVSVDASVTDLFFRKSLLLHKSVLNGPDSNPFWRKFSVAGHRRSFVKARRHCLIPRKTRFDSRTSNHMQAAPRFIFGTSDEPVPVHRRHFIFPTDHRMLTTR